MFVRQKKNKGDVISIQVIDKSSGKYKVVKTIGSSNDCNQIDKLFIKARQWVRERQGLIEIDFTQERLHVEQILDSIQQITVVGTDILLGRIFNEIGFSNWFYPGSVFRSASLKRPIIFRGIIQLMWAFKIFIVIWISFTINKKRRYNGSVIHIL